MYNCLYSMENIYKKHKKSYREELGKLEEKREKQKEEQKGKNI